MSYEHNPSKGWLKTTFPRPNYGMARDQNGQVLERMGEETNEEFKRRIKPAATNHTESTT